MRSTYRLPLAVLGGAALIAAALALKPSSSAPGAPPPAQAATAATEPGALVPYLRFTGNGTVTVRPDTAEIYVSTVATGATSKAALDAVSRKMTKVQDRLAELGVAKDAMTTNGASTYQDFDSKRWRAELSLTVKVPKIEEAGKLIAEANAAGADGVGGPSFSVDDTRAAYASALRQAIDDARAKAEAAAAQMGVKVGGIVSVDDQAGGVQPPLFAAEAAKASADAAGSAPVPVPVEPGTQDVTAGVTVVFTYSPATP
jgi:uncharacterized protein YggE